MAAFCWSLELLQAPCAEQTQPRWVVLAGLCRMNKSAQRNSENLFLLLCATQATRHATFYTLQFIRLVLFNFTGPPKIKGITNDLACWSRIGGTLHSCPAKEDQSQTTALLPICLALSTGLRCRCKVPEKVFQHPIEDNSLPSNSSLAPAVPRIKSCHAGLVLWWGCSLRVTDD